MPYTVTPERVLVMLAVYGALLVTILPHAPRVAAAERRTWLVLGLVWGSCVFAANWLLFRLGAMSFLPWANNALHSLVWIGGCLGWLYLGVRSTRTLPMQIVLFAVYSLIVKYAERLVFGTWDLEHFFWILPGNAFYVLGWSLLDGLYPVISLLGLRLLGRRVSGLVVV